MYPSLNYVSTFYKMKTKLVFATNNMHKLREVQAMMPADIELITLREAGIEEDIIESGSTFNENALIKAQFVYNKTGINCFADDSGLMIEALNNAPGVYSARYAGEPKDDVKNLQRGRGWNTDSKCEPGIMVLIPLGMHSKIKKVRLSPDPHDCIQ